MNILLISPEFPESFWSFKEALKYIRKKACLPPLGLLTVAAILPQNWNKRLVDMNVSKLKEKDLEWADYAFISAMTIQREACQKVIKRCKEAGLKIVGGGPIFSIPDDRFDEVDHFILNEAEITLPQFLVDLEKGAPKKIYETREFADMAESPVPLWELADLKQYSTASVQYSRGCPYDCEFCNITAMFGPNPRIKPADKVIAELDNLYGNGWRGMVFFVDDNFIGNKHKLKNDLMPRLIEWRAKHPEISFRTEVSINLADDAELMKMMTLAGFDTVFVGIETPSAEGLEECGKTHNLNRDLYADVKKIQRAGLQVQAGFILGFDSDDEGIFDRQIEFIQRSGITIAMVGRLQAPFGTKLRERLEREGRLSEERIWGNHIDGDSNIVPLMKPETLLQGFQKVVAHIYSPKNHYLRMITFLKTYRPPEVAQPVRWRDITAFMRVAFRIGLVGRERFYFWKLLRWTRRNRPMLLPVAVNLAVYGRNFRLAYKTLLASKSAPQNPQGNKTAG